MASPFDTLFQDTGESLLRSFLGDTVSIKRGSRLTSGVVAQLFLGNGVVTDEEGVTTTVEYLEAIIAVTAYTFTGLGAVNPVTGDRLIDQAEKQWQCGPVLQMKETQLLPGGTEWLVRYKAI